MLIIESIEIYRPVNLSRIIFPIYIMLHIVYIMFFLIEFKIWKRHKDVLAHYEHWSLKYFLYKGENKNDALNRHIEDEKRECWWKRRQ